MDTKYKRVLLKISGEALSGSKGYGLDVETMHDICMNIKKIVDMLAQKPYTTYRKFKHPSQFLSKSEMYKLSREYYKLSNAS